MASFEGFAPRTVERPGVELGSAGPQIAVVIGAVEREGFVVAAVDSVLAQTLPREEFEILVTQDVPSTRVEEYLHANGVRTLWDPDRSQGRVVRAARATRAPLIAYLDDDDMFEPGKLVEVLALFRDHPEISFYRNRVSVVNESGEAIRAEEWDRLYLSESLDRSGPLLIAPSSKRTRWAEAVRSYPEFNLSSMVVRRELVDGERGARLERMVSRIDLGTSWKRTSVRARSTSMTGGSRGIGSTARTAAGFESVRVSECREAGRSSGTWRTGPRTKARPPWSGGSGGSKSRPVWASIPTASPAPSGVELPLRRSPPMPGSTRASSLSIRAPR